MREPRELCMGVSRTPYFRCCALCAKGAISWYTPSRLRQGTTKILISKGFTWLWRTQSRERTRGDCEEELRAAVDPDGARGGRRGLRRFLRREERAVLMRLIAPGREAAEILDPRTDFDLEPVWQDHLGAAPPNLGGWSFYVPAAPAAPSPDRRPRSRAPGPAASTSCGRGAWRPAASICCAFTFASR